MKVVISKKLWGGELLWWIYDAIDRRNPIGILNGFKTRGEAVIFAEHNNYIVAGIEDD